MSHIGPIRALRGICPKQADSVAPKKGEAAMSEQTSPNQVFCFDAI
jgi:hypothetical protein